MLLTLVISHDYANNTCKYTTSYKIYSNGRKLKSVINLLFFLLPKYVTENPFC